MGVKEKMTAIADAIRKKTGKTEALGLDAMAQSIQQVYDAGAKSEQNNFWDAFQRNGNKTDYNYAFFRFPFSVFYPKYDLRPTGNAERMFWNFDGYKADVSSRLQERGVTLDTSKATDLSTFFAGSGVTVIPTISTISCAKPSNLFGYCDYLHTIEKLIFKDDGSQTIGTGLFGNCPALENLTIEGVIGCNGFNVQWSTKLTHDSLMSIINALQNKDSGTWTVTLGTTNLAKLTDAEKAIATQKGWTLA